MGMKKCGIKTIYNYYRFSMLTFSISLKLTNYCHEMHKYFDVNDLLERKKKEIQLTRLKKDTLKFQITFEQFGKKS